MDIKNSVTAAMDEVINRSKVSLDQGNLPSPLNKDASTLSEEERKFYKLMFGDDIASVRHRRLHCTACDVHLGSAPANSANMYAHPVLFTLLCASCRRFYGDGNFEQGEDATDMFCRWCANGGNLYCCSYCSNTFCNKCIKRNFDSVVRRKIEDEERWKCFVCDPKDLYTARAVCWALMLHVQTVTRILQTDSKITKKILEEKMNLDESTCCSRRRKARRRKLSLNEFEEEDEMYQPFMEDVSPLITRKIPKRSPRGLSVTNGEREKSVSNAKIGITAEQEIDIVNDDFEDELLPPMIPCVQSMVEGESSEILNETLNTPSNLSQLSTSRDQSISLTPPTLQINPIPTANLLKVVQPPPLTPIRNNLGKRKHSRPLQHILPAPQPKFLMMKNPSSQNSPSQNVHGVEYDSPLVRSQSLQPNVPTVGVPATTSPPPRHHTIEYSSLPLRVPNIPASGYKQTSRMMVHKPKPASTSVEEVGVIEIDSDSDETGVEESDGKDTSEPSVCRGRDILTNILNKRLPDMSAKKRGEKTSNEVEEEIDLRTEEVRMLFKVMGMKLRKVPLLHLPNHNNLRSTRVKTRRFHLAITKAISMLSDINDKVVHKYSSWRTSMLEESRQTRSSDTTTSERNNEFTIPLDMICTNSESDSDNNDDLDAEDMLITEKVRSIKSFQERDTVDVGVGDPISTADKSVQVFDVVERDYEKCIAHSILTKIEYDPVDGSEILKPVIVPAEYDGKYEEQFIFYLQHREENKIETDDDKGLPDPNETPLKDLIESNSPFVLEMLESIDSPLATGMITDELATEASNESGKENKNQSEQTNVVIELSEMLTELSEEVKTSKNSETLSKKHTEHSKKDRRKQILESTGSAEVDIAVQTLIEEDERSRSSSNDDEITSRNVKQFELKGKQPTLGYSEDECTIID